MIVILLGDKRLLNQIVMIVILLGEKRFLLKRQLSFGLGGQNCHNNIDNDRDFIDQVKLPWYADCSWRDIRDIIPSLLILFIGNLTHLHLTLITELILPPGIGIMILIIPYAFASVIKQLQMEEEIARWPILGESPPKK